MSTAEAVSDSWRSTLEDDIGLRDREATAVVAVWPTEEAFLDAYLADETFTDHAGIGRRTSDRLYRYISESHPDTEREKIESAEKYCTEFTTDHGLDGESDAFRFAFICPRDETVNPLHGDPAEFKNRPFRCEGCGWVPLLDGVSLAELREEHYPTTSGSEYVLTDADGDVIPGEIYQDSERAVDSRARLMAEHEDGDAVTVEERETQ